MPRQLRLVYEGAIYHVMNRGDRRERIVGSDDDRKSFVATLAEASTQCGWERGRWESGRSCLLTPRLSSGIFAPFPDNCDLNMKGLEQRAERIVVEALRAAGWSQGRLETEPKGHPIKVELAKRLRRETTMSLRWIAERLCMGRWTNVSNLLCAARNSALRPQNQKENSTTHVKR